MNPNYFYDIEMPPPATPLWVGLLLAAFVVLALLFVLLRYYKRQQPEIMALTELRSLSSLDPFQLASLLREGLQYRHLPRVLPAAFMQDLDQARYAPSPEVELSVLFNEADKLLTDKAGKLDAKVLFARLWQALKNIQWKAYWHPAQRYLDEVFSDYFSWLKSLWRRGND